MSRFILIAAIAVVLLPPLTRAQAPVSADPSSTAAKPNKPKRLPSFIKPLPADAPPPTSDPRDFTGPWLQLDRTPAKILDAQGGSPPLNARGLAAQERTVKATEAGHPLIYNPIVCRPPGMLYLLGLYFPLRVVQNEREVVFLFERFHSTWRIFIDQAHPAALEKSYNGHSVGRWEGNTLVVDTVGLRGGLWLDESGTELSDAAHLSTRITKRTSDATLELITRIDDPKTYSAPWTVHQVLDWRPDFSLLNEHDCEETAGSVDEAKQYGYSSP